MQVEVISSLQLHYLSHIFARCTVGNLKSEIFCFSKKRHDAKTFATLISIGPNCFRTARCSHNTMSSTIFKMEVLAERHVVRVDTAGWYAVQ